jgi:hypothetical protein
MSGTSRIKPAVIPAWTPEGVLPPINASQPVSPERSPYSVSLTDYVLRFGSTPERRAVLDGYLRYRRVLHAAGLIKGFQWLDGSFLEHVEMIEGRSPNDMDVVTFYHLPGGISQRQLAAQAPGLTDGNLIKSTFRVDAYLVHLGMRPPERLARWSAYWYSMWSHRRDRLWKGFVQVDLSPGEDTAAEATLASLASGGAQP